MFFARKKRSGLATDPSGVSDPGKSQRGERESCQWLAWRRSAQRVTRAWNEWLAADCRHRPEICRCYLTALAEEERAAAEVERVVTVTE